MPLWRFLGRRALSPLTAKRAELCYLGLVAHLKGGTPRQIVLGLWRELASLYPSLDGPGANHRLPMTDTDRIAWEVSCLTIDRINEQIAKAWGRGGSWRAAIAEGVPDDLGGVDPRNRGSGGVLHESAPGERGAGAS